MLWSGRKKSLLTVHLTEYYLDCMKNSKTKKARKKPINGLMA